MIEENIENREQPTQFNVHAVATDDVNGTVKECEGSLLGKFKDTKSLMNAYNELQGEFTRKCQKLSEVEKKLKESPISNNTSQNEIVGVSNEFAWKKNISEFLQTHKNAKTLSEEITKEIIEDSSLRENENALEVAYSRVIEKKYIPETELVKNQDFLEKYIYSNEEIKNKIIKEYVSSIQNSQNPIIINNSGFNRGATSNLKINNFDEAKKYVEKLFKF